MVRNDLIKTIDNYLDKTNKPFTTPAELRDDRIIEISNKYLRDILRKGKIPHAYQDGVSWRIPHSKGMCTIPQKPSQNKNPRKPRSESDEHYVIGLCNQLLHEEAEQQYRGFDFLLRDPGKTGKCSKLPVDAYYKNINLVIEYHEKQHTESVKLFDKKETISGCSRGEQRKRYDKRREELFPKHSVDFLVIDYTSFNYSKNKKIIRDKVEDIEILKTKLRKYIAIVK